VIRPEHRGKALGVMHAGWAVGWGVAALLYALFFRLEGAKENRDEILDIPDEPVAEPTS